MAGGAGVDGAGVPVADGGGEELEEASGGVSEDRMISLILPMAPRDFEGTVNRTFS
jgi:hypothetical protein